MEQINWRFLLTHPSEFVRIDEQLRLLQIHLSNYQKQFLTDSILQEIYEHELTIIGFRNALNIFGINLFQTDILSDGEICNQRGTSIEKPKSANFFLEYTNMSQEMFQKLFCCLADKKNTEKIFKQFLIVIFDEYINANNLYLSVLSDKEKENIMLDIIKRVHAS